MTLAVNFRETQFPKIADLMCRAGLTSSTREAQRLISEGAVRIERTAVAGSDATIGPFRGSRVLTVGKRRHVVLTPVYTPPKD